MLQLENVAQPYHKKKKTVTELQTAGRAHLVGGQGSRSNHRDAILDGIKKKKKNGVRTNEETHEGARTQMRRNVEGCRNGKDYRV